MCSTLQTVIVTTANGKAPSARFKTYTKSYTVIVSADSLLYVYVSESENRFRQFLIGEKVKKLKNRYRSWRYRLAGVVQWQTSVRLCRADDFIKSYTKSYTNSECSAHSAVIELAYPPEYSSLLMGTFN